MSETTIDRNEIARDLRKEMRARIENSQSSFSQSISLGIFDPTEHPHSISWTFEGCSFKIFSGCCSAEFEWLLCYFLGLMLFFGF